MLGLPASTEFNKRIPKQKFYENLNISPALKRLFIDQIKLIYWRNKLAATTMNLPAGQAVTEIEVFEIRLQQLQLDETVLKLIDKEIPYHILFVLSYEGQYQAWIGYKEATAPGGSTFKVDRYFHTDWWPENERTFTIEGLDLDKVYENLVRQIAGSALESAGPDETLKETVEREKQRKKLEKQIAALEKKIRKERQFNLQVEMNAQLKKLKVELEEMKNDNKYDN